MVLSPTPSTFKYQVVLFHYGPEVSSDHWVALDQIQGADRRTQTALLACAQFQDSKIPNWPQSFSRRGLNANDFVPTFTCPLPAPPPHTSVDLCYFSAKAGQEQVIFRWRHGTDSVLEGDVVTMRRTELKTQLKMRSCQVFLVPLAFEQELQGTRYSVDFNDITALAKRCDSPTAQLLKKEILSQWDGASLIRMCQIV